MPSYIQYFAVTIIELNITKNKDNQFWDNASTKGISCIYVTNLYLIIAISQRNMTATLQYRAIKKRPIEW